MFVNNKLYVQRYIIRPNMIKTIEFIYYLIYILRMININIMSLVKTSYGYKFDIRDVWKGP